MEEQKKEDGQEMENKNPTEQEAASQAQAEDTEITDQEAAQDNTESQSETEPEDGEAEDTQTESDTDSTDADHADTQEEEAEKQGGTEKKGFFKKNKKKDKKDEKIEELTDQVKRQMAEFDNFRKRTEKEKSQMYEIGAKSIIEKVLPVVDNFERGLAAVPEENKDDAFVDGMNKIYKQMLAMLEEVDVKPIEAVGKEFDPNLHNAVMQTESDEYESGIVAQELQKGYMYRDSVVRHSMVAVVS